MLCMVCTCYGLLSNCNCLYFRYFEDVTYEANVDVDKFRSNSVEAPGTFTFCSSMTVFISEFLDGQGFCL